jgi:Flp pilus assembly protein TadG
MRVPCKTVHPRRGAIAVLVAILLPVLLMVAAFAINLSYMRLVRAELRVAADAAARAGSRSLSLTQSTAGALSAAQEAASRNLVGGAPLVLEADKVEFGLNSRPNTASPWTFTPNGGIGPVNAVRVTGDRTASSASGSVNLLFTPYLTQKTFQPQLQSVAMQTDRDIILIVDRSGSMSSPATQEDRDLMWDLYYNDYDTYVAAVTSGDTPWNTRWDSLSAAVDAFLETLVRTIPEEQVALVWFDHQVGTAVDLTLNYADIQAAMDQLTPRGSTAIGRGLAEGVGALQNELTARPYAHKTTVLMTDGHHNTGERPDSVATRELEDHHFMIHSVTFGEGADQQLMQSVADIGGGRHWHAPDDGALQAAYVDIANDIPTVLTQ